MRVREREREGGVEIKRERGEIEGGGRVCERERWRGGGGARA